jgi:hypothetical protein
MINALTDHPRTDPDTPEPLPDVATLGPWELANWLATHARHDHHDRQWREDTFTPEEREHWRAVEAACDLHDAARRHTISQGLTTYSAAIAAWERDHPLDLPY